MQIVILLKHALSKPNIFSAFFSTTLLFTFTLIFLSGCAGPQKDAKKLRYVFPPLPDEPRIEWLATYRSQNDFPKTPQQAFRESILGKDPEKSFRMPWGVASDGKGKVYVTDSQEARVVVYDMNLQKVRNFGAKEGGEEAGFDGLYSLPLDMAVDDSGNLYVVDQEKKKVFSFTKEEEALGAFGDGILQKPIGIGVDSRLKRAYVADAGNHSVAVFDLATGSHLFSFGKKGDGDGEFRLPTDAAVAPNGEVVILDGANARVQIFDAEGKFLRKFGRRGDGVTDLQMPKSIALNRDGNIYLTEARHHRVMVFDLNGVALQVFGVEDKTGGTIGGFFLPRGIYIDGNERLYVVDSLHKRFKVFQIINEEWLKENPIREEELAKPKETKKEEIKK